MFIGFLNVTGKVNDLPAFKDYDGQGWYSAKTFPTINPSLIFGLSPSATPFRNKNNKNSVADIP